MRLSKLAILAPLLFSINSISQTFPNDGYARPYKPITPAPIFIQGPPDQANMFPAYPATPNPNAPTPNPQAPTPAPHPTPLASK